MSCLSCASNYQKEFAAEMIIHFSGLKNLHEPGVWAFPKLYVCMNCGFSHFTIQEPSGTLCKQRSAMRACNTEGQV
jgi:hypothetical protein